MLWHFVDPRTIMAWNASSGPWKQPLTQNPNANDTSFPGLKPTGGDAASKIDNTEVQENELLALEAIYGEDFVNHTGEQSAWKVCASRRESLHEY